jgi:pimeloyl-ACP methyl ester carboxylesterase
MMRNFYTLCFLLIAPVLMAKTTIYLFPGEGSDERIFSKMSFDSNYRVVHVVLPTPDSGATMQSYAKAISLQIDTSENFIFIGVSLGGMVCVELSDYLKPLKTIIISSAKCRSELPHRYRFQRIVPINKLVPEKLVKTGARFLQPIVEPDRDLHAEIFNSMLAGKSPTYYKRTVDLILNWKRNKAPENIIHIHGTNDHTLPIRNIKADYVIEGGSHMMTLTRGEEVNGVVQEVLRK